MLWGVEKYPLLLINRYVVYGEAIMNQVRYKFHDEIDSHTVAFLKQLKKTKDIRRVSIQEINELMEYMFQWKFQGSVDQLDRLLAF